MKLLTHQAKAFEKQLPNKVGALFMKMGTGKTRVAVELVNAVPDVDLVVWVGPLRTIKPLEDYPSIIDEVNKWGGFQQKEVLYIGVESIGMSDRQYLQLYKKLSIAWRCFLIVDESIKIKNFEAKRTQRLLELSKMAEYKLILNGEPITRDLLDLWPQFQFLDPEIIRMSLSEFKNTFCKYTTVTKSSPGYGRTYTKEFITGYENIDYLYSLIGEYVYECDLELNVSQVFDTINYTIDDDARESYNELKRKFLDDEMMEFRNNNIFLEMTMKMQHEYCCSESKFQALNDWFMHHPEAESIIYCKYISSAAECKKRYPKATVLNYKTGSLGLNLQHLPYTVYFDQTFDWGDIVQASHRNYRTGQQKDVRYLRLIGNVGLEKMMLENNQKKVNISEYLKSISKKQLKEIL